MGGPVDGSYIDTLNPATGAVIASVAQGGSADVDWAVKAARRALESPPYGTMDAADRGRLLLKLVDLVEAHAPDLTVLESLNSGKTLNDSHGDIQGVANTLRYYGGWADKIEGRTPPVRGNFLTYPLRQPVGVVGQIIPWNCPLLMLTWKLGPAIACGNTIVLKPAEQTPLTALRLAELADRARQRRVVDPLDAATEQGPQVSQEQLDKILGYITLGQQQGANLITGGHRIGDQGFFVEPTIFDNVRDDMQIATDEIFGPVVSVHPFKDVNELIGRANNTYYGLSAGIWTKNIDKAHLFAKQVNCYHVVDTTTPFGGFKMSGHGRENGEAALELYTEMKTVTINLG